MFTCLLIKIITMAFSFTEIEKKIKLSLYCINVECDYVKIANMKYIIIILHIVSTRLLSSVGRASNSKFEGQVFNT